MKPKRILIVGGSAGGASAALRARQLSEEAEILVFERGPHVSFANSALPSFVDSDLQEPDPDLFQTPAVLKAQHNLDVRTRTVVLGLDRANRQIEVCEVDSECRYHEPYDAILLSTGAAPVRPRVPGSDREGLFAIRHATDLERCLHWVRDYQASRAVILGGDPTGLSLAEQLKRRGLSVAVVDASPSLFTRLDPEMAALVEVGLRSNGVETHLGSPIVAFETPTPSQPARAAIVALENGRRLPADIVILALGSRPETGLARAAGLEIGPAGGLRVDAHFRTSDPQVWAVGEAVELPDPITGESFAAPWATPALRQGRIAAESMFGLAPRCPGAFRPGLFRFFQLAAGHVGATASALAAAQVPFVSSILHSNPHGGYRPTTESLGVKLLFSPDSGRLLGGQAVGVHGVERCVDVLATALQAGLTISDLAEFDLPQRPPHGTGQSPLNCAGHQAAARQRGEIRMRPWPAPNAPLTDLALIDLREKHERGNGLIPGARLLPGSELRRRADELPRDQELLLFCLNGDRSGEAARYLGHRGFSAWGLDGGFRTWSALGGSVIPAHRP